MKPRVGIVVLNWNGAPDTLRCIASLSVLDYPTYRIVVVDNASQPEDIRALAAGLGSDIELILSTENTGYAGGNNLGIQRLRDRYDPDFYWILNNDTTVEPDSLDTLIAYAAAHPEDGAIGSTVLGNDPERIYCLGGGTLNRWTGIDHLVGSGTRRETATPTGHLDYICGACILLSRGAVEATNGFDADYFLYSEEVDLCERLRRSGLGLGYAPDSVIHHTAARSTGYHSPTYVYYFLRGKLRFQMKWARPWQWATFVPSFALIYISGFLLKAALATRPLPVRPIIQAIADAFGNRWGRQLNPPAEHAGRRG